MAQENGREAHNAGDRFKDAAEQARTQMESAGNAVTQNSAQLGLKILSQAEINTQEAFRAMRAAAQASDITEVMRIQSDYLREQGNRAMNQAREVGEMIAEFGRNATADMTRRD